jgi:protein tyrosine phosphatase
MYINIYDSEDSHIEQYFDQTFAFIENHIKRGENVLVHCWAGVSRSATIVLNYMLRKFYEKRNRNVCACRAFSRALEYAVSERPVVNPNNGFKYKLFERTKFYRDNNI